jgi:hypothetical protein
MGIASEIVESIAEATGLARTTIRSTFNEIEATLGSRLGVMQQRVTGIMANAKGSGGIDDVVTYTDGALTAGEKARVFGALGLGFIGGFLLASAAGSIAVLLVGLVCLAGAGMLLLSYAKSLIGKLTEAIDAF